MRPLKKLIGLDDAYNIIFSHLNPINEIEEIPLLQLTGRVAAEDVIADMNVPPFKRAAMDGFAVQGHVTFGATDDTPVILKKIETIHAGDVPEKKIDEKTCAEIATGAMLPEGADTVVQVEYTNSDGDNIEIFKALAPGTNVSKEGVDIKKGETVIRKGDVFTPGRIGVLAALNKPIARVYRKPKVAIIPTGREIAPLGSDLKPGQVYDINSYTITALVRQHGGEPDLYEIVPDSFDELEAAILKAVDEADLILILGGSSVGERDINIDVIEKHGKVFYHGVQIRPGKPGVFGVIKDKPVLNLPGYPTSCLTNGYVFVIPAIRKLGRLPPEPKRTVKAKMARKITSRLGRHQFFTVRLVNGEAVPAYKESGAITSIAWADGYIEIPYNQDLIEKGDEVEVILF